MNQPESRDLRELLDSAQLTALPQSAIRLIQLSQNPDKGPLEFAAPIESDPGLTVQVLRFVNSSYFGFRQEISSVKLAISLVGIRTIKNFALWSAVFSLMPNPKCGPFDLRRLWQDSLRRAVFARIFGKLLGSTEAEDLFAAALLQDMAVPLLAKEMPECYRELLEAREDGMHRLSDLEQERFGWTHARAGGVLARRWGLPENFATMIETHTLSSQDEGRNQAPRHTAIVLTSALLPSVCDSEWRDEEAFRSSFTDLAAGRNASVSEIFQRVDTEFTEFAPLLKLATPARSLVDSLSSQDVAGVAQ
jgi:HD-like signal output (HDOD) protein